MPPKAVLLLVSDGSIHVQATILAIRPTTGRNINSVGSNNDQCFIRETNEMNHMCRITNRQQPAAFNSGPRDFTFQSMVLLDNFIY